MRQVKMLIVIVLLLSACTVGNEGVIDEPLVESEAANDEDVTAVPAATIPTEMPASAPAGGNEVPAKPTNTNAPPTATTGSNAVEPVTVDLGQLTPSGTAVATTPQIIPAPGIPDPLVTLVNTVSHDLAERLKIDLSEVGLVETASVEWSDSSLGCPQPGMGYLTVITPGYLIVLSAQGEEYSYHTNQQGSYFVLCGKDGRPLPG